MSSRKDWQEWMDATEVHEKNGNFYLGSTLRIKYDSYEEAKNASEILREIIAF